MTIDELEAFVTVARTSNIGAAAKRLGVPQATLSDPPATPCSAGCSSGDRDRRG